MAKFNFITSAELEHLNSDSLNVRFAACNLMRQLIPRCQSPIEKDFLRGWVFLCETTLDNDSIFAKVVDIHPQYEFENYRLDFAWPAAKVAVELDGHQWHSSKEQRGKDAEKGRALTLAGWKLLRFTGTQIHNDVYACTIEVEALLKEIPA